MKPLARCTITVLVSLLPGTASAQSYRPAYEQPGGTELVAVYLTSRTCLGCRAPGMPAVLDSIKVELQRQARSTKQRFRAVFVDMDWEADSGIAMAREDGTWDEMIVGRNWVNAGAERYIWGDSATMPVLPQMVLLEQQVEMKSRVVFGPRRVLHRAIGIDALRTWLHAGLPRSP